MLRGSATQVYPCDGEVFFLDRGLLMGAIRLNLAKLKVTSGNLAFSGITQTVGSRNLQSRGISATYNIWTLFL
jgi:hypothetical protein